MFAFNISMCCFLVGQWEQVGGTSTLKELTPSLTPQKLDIPGPHGTDFPPGHPNGTEVCVLEIKNPEPQRKPVYWWGEGVTGPLM